MTEPGDKPTDSAIADWTGSEAHPYWKRVIHLIEQIYPDVFTPECSSAAGNMVGP
jgi:hypothetical protein